MSAEHIADLGPGDARLRPNPQADTTALPLSSEEYFVWTRVDGHTSIQDLLLMSAFPRRQTIEILKRLHAIGVLLKPDETPAQAAPRLRAAGGGGGAKPTPTPKPSASARSRDTGRQRPAQAAASRATKPKATASAAEPKTAASATKPTTDGYADAIAALGALSDDETAALAAEVELDPERRIRIVTVRRQHSRADHFAVLGVAADVGARDLKRAYFKLSKEFHPDRYYGRHTGPFEPWLADIFQRVKGAYEVLSDKKQRAAYERKLAGKRAAPASQSKTEYAAELFERACAAQLSGDLDGALVLFAGALRLDAQIRYLSRAARCAIENRDSKTALEYARLATESAPNDPSLQRVLAAAQVAAGELEQAAATLERALTLKTENDALMSGIRVDLDRVRAGLARRGDRST